MCLFYCVRVNGGLCQFTNWLGDMCSERCAYAIHSAFTGCWCGHIVLWGFEGGQNCIKYIRYSWTTRANLTTECPTDGHGIASASQNFMDPIMQPESSKRMRRPQSTITARVWHTLCDMFDIDWFVIINVLVVVRNPSAHKTYFFDTPSNSCRDSRK